MKQPAWKVVLAAGLAWSAASVGGCGAGRPASGAEAPSVQNTGVPSMKLGNFSISLAVKDIAASRAFYEKLGFKAVSGDQSKNWLVMQSEGTKIGLFQGMFPKNTLTFNPGWDHSAHPLPEFTDIRELQRTFKDRGLTPAPAIAPAAESGDGPAFFMLTDPDGNPVLFDQHVSKPK
jgi:catechol 2,3-dioxygenase-like lactoylglutathione lyase family enzyme